MTGIFPAAPGDDLTRASGAGRERATGDFGAGLVTGLALVFAFTFLGLVWLARDVDRGVSNRTAAQSIAFQAARSGAQELSIAALRSGAAVTIDESAARGAVLHTAGSLFASYGVHGTVDRVAIHGDEVEVTLSIHDAGITVTGVGSVRAERAP